MFKGLSHEETQYHKKKEPFNVSDFILNHNGFTLIVALIAIITFGSKWQSKLDQVDDLKTTVNALVKSDNDKTVTINTLSTILENKYCISSSIPEVKGVATSSANLTK